MRLTVQQKVTMTEITIHIGILTKLYTIPSPFHIQD